MIIKKLVVGPLENNCYIIGDENTREALVVDPGDEPDRILEIIGENNLILKYIVCTHAHFDHIGVVNDIKKETDASVVLNAEDLFLYTNVKTQASLWGIEVESLPAPDIFVSEGDTLKLGNLKFEIFHTPGHTPGGICLYGENILITGDTLFADSVGRTDLHGGDLEKLKSSFKRLMSLPDKTRVLPGHGPESTIGREKVNNFFSDI